MPNNEKVSSLLELFATDVESRDIFLVTDMSQRESKKLEVGQLLLFIENSGSFLAYDSFHAATASYILASGIDGVVAVAANASHSISSSWTSFGVSSSYANTSSFAFFASSSANNNADTASFLKYTGTPNGTASYSMNSLAADSSTTAYNLFYNGLPNGTASLAISASNVISSSYSVTASNSNTSSFSLLASSAVSSLSASNSILSIMAQTASYLINNGPQFLTTPVAIYNSSLATSGFVTIDVSAYIPHTATTVILQYAIFNHSNDSAGFIYIRKNSLSTQYTLASYQQAGAYVGWAGQGMFPVFNQSFQYSVTDGSIDGVISIKLIGYY